MDALGEIIQASETAAPPEPRRRASSPWTSDRDDAMRSLAADGYTASQIAAELGCFEHCDDGGRCAVIGRARRIGVALLGPKRFAPRISLAEKWARLQAKEARRQERRERRAAEQAGKAERRRRREARAAPRPNRRRWNIPSFNTGMTRAQRILYMRSLNMAIEAEPADPDEHLMAPDMRRLSLMELNDETCRFPIGVVGGPGFFFCGAAPAIGQPYCGFHDRIAHQCEAA